MNDLKELYIVLYLTEIKVKEYIGIFLSLIKDALFANEACATLTENH